MVDVTVNSIFVEDLALKRMLSDVDYSDLFEKEFVLPRAQVRSFPTNVSREHLRKRTKSEPRSSSSPNYGDIIDTNNNQHRKSFTNYGSSDKTAPPSPGYQIQKAAEQELENDLEEVNKTYSFLYATPPAGKKPVPRPRSARLGKNDVRPTRNPLALPSGEEEEEQVLPKSTKSSQKKKPQEGGDYDLLATEIHHKVNQAAPSQDKVKKTKEKTLIAPASTGDGNWYFGPPPASSRSTLSFSTHEDKEDKETFSSMLKDTAKDQAEEGFTNFLAEGSIDPLDMLGGGVEGMGGKLGGKLGGKIGSKLGNAELGEQVGEMAGDMAMDAATGAVGDLLAGEGLSPPEIPDASKLLGKNKCSIQ